MEAGLSLCRLCPCISSMQLDGDEKVLKRFQDQRG